MIYFDDTALMLPAYRDIWFTEDDSRYRVLKGGRSTGKTYQFVGLEPYFKIFSDPRRNILMVRQNDKDNAQSNFTILKNLSRKYGISHLFKFQMSPHKIIYKQTGQCILFGGMNDVENIAGTSVDTGYWTDIYFEEASQLRSYEEFRVVDGSIRVPNYESDLHVQITFLMNAWDMGHWTYETFFKGRLEDDVPTLEEFGYQYMRDPDFNIGYGDGISLHISSYKCNPYLSEGQVKGALTLKEKAYDIYKVESLGCWGKLNDKTYSHWDDGLICTEYEINAMVFEYMAVGIDFGMSNGEGRIKYSEANAKRLGSANTMQLLGVTNNWGKIISVDEYFDSNEGRSEADKKSSVTIQREMIDTLMRWYEQYRLNGTLVCYVDCADSGGFIDGLVMEAMRRGAMYLRFMPASKIPIISRVYFENMLMAFGDHRLNKKCKNLIREIKNARKTKEGRVREDYDDHAINAFEYAWIPLRKRLVRWKSFKEPLKAEGSDI